MLYRAVLLALITMILRELWPSFWFLGWYLQGGGDEGGEDDNNKTGADSKPGKEGGAEKKKQK
uniref:Uncharacterized protein n=2 Tax=Meloidogyne TaxID=189290 RepID=A0A6V7WCZ8_MELEN|nr:unnamed protein product [Meloidogyne enterolobii]